MSRITSTVMRGQQGKFTRQHSTYRNLRPIDPRGGSGNGETNLPIRPVLSAFNMLESDNLLTLASRFALKRCCGQPDQFKFRSSKMSHRGAPSNDDHSTSAAVEPADCTMTAAECAPHPNDLGGAA